MKCQICEQAEAVLHLQEIADDTRKEVHLCKSCAEKRGVLENIASLDFSLDSIMFESTERKTKEHGGDVQIKCSVCGFELHRLQDVHYLGCVHCYHEFQELLRPALDDIHAGTTHCGRYPHQSRIEKKQRRKIAALTKKLQKTLKQEDYEKAAAIRDKISRLENTLDEENPSVG